MSRILLFTGKGGTGKTTVSAATAVCAAKLGYKTLAISTDSAHSLGDSLERELGPEPVLISKNLWAQESNILYNLEKHWGTIKKWLAALMAWRGLDEIVAEEVAVLPGMEELANLLWVYYYEQEQTYDVVVVDCAPTAESLRLLTLPEVAGWWFKKLLPVGKKLMPIATPIVNRVTDMPLPDKEILDSVEELFYRMEGLRALLSDPKKTSIRLLLNPEKMVIKEAQRTYAYLNLYGYPTDAVVCNRIIPARADGTYFEKWKKAQAGYLQDIEERFSPLPVMKVPLLESEAVGLKRLAEVGEYLYRGDDPTRVFFEGQPIDIEQEDGCYTLTMKLPFISKADVSLLRSGDELVITIGNQRRSVILPQALLERQVKEAKFDSGELKVIFEEEGQV
ncbi:MAG TPA: TRC40/GET3/ArsA family transport-energizing ATPase [Candidatus Saccharicenans sp.]|nr:TRC40/GET3/ArsA family transport-energizing ATPase [Candidatus Saccharicenans sp.]